MYLLKRNYLCWQNLNWTSLCLTNTSLHNWGKNKIQKYRYSNIYTEICVIMMSIYILSRCINCNFTSRILWYILDFSEKMFVVFSGRQKHEVYSSMKMMLFLYPNPAQAECKQLVEHSLKEKNHEKWSEYKEGWPLCLNFTFTCFSANEQIPLLFLFFHLLITRRIPLQTLSLTYHQFPGLGFCQCNEII